MICIGIIGFIVAANVAAIIVFAIQKLILEYKKRLLKTAMSDQKIIIKDKTKIDF